MGGLPCLFGLRLHDKRAEILTASPISKARMSGEHYGRRHWCLRAQAAARSTGRCSGLRMIRLQPRGLCTGTQGF